MEADQLDALLAVTAAMEQLEVPFFIAGSFASNAYGFYRATADADLVADVKVRHIEPLVEALRGRFNIATEAVRQAVMTRGWTGIAWAAACRIDSGAMSPA